ncbi:MAG: MBL fold metallo-hydrolase [Clostridia bacterium]
MAAKNKKSTVKAAKKAIKSAKLNINVVILAAVIIIALIVGVTVFRTEVGEFIKNISAPCPEPTEDFEVNPSVLGGSTLVSLPVELGEIGLEIHFIDVGQGDAIVVRFPDGKDMIVDAGSTSGGGGVSHLLDYLQLINIDYFDYMLATHHDADHIGMLDDVLGAYQVHNIYYNGDSHTTQAFTNFDTAAKAEGAEIYRFDEDGGIYDTKIVGEDYKVVIYAPGYDRFDGFNADSPIVSIEYAGRRVLLTGDAEQLTEQWFIDQIDGDIYDCDVLKVGHHGSASSSATYFLDFIQAEYAVISVGDVNSYAHPDPMVMNKLFDRGMVTYRTNRHGNIVLYIDEDGEFAFGTEREEITENNRFGINDRQIIAGEG